MDGIENIPESSREEALRNIEGINVYDSSTLKNEVVKKINEDIKEKEAAAGKKKINDLLKQIRILKDCIELNEKAHATISRKSFTEATLLKLKSLKAQKEKYQQQLKIYENKLIKAQFSLRVHDQKVAASHTEQRTEKETKDLASFSGTYDRLAVSSAKTLEERKKLIRQGLATPFSFAKQSTSLKLDSSFGESLVCPPKEEVAKFSDDHVDKNNKTIKNKSTKTQKRRPVIDPIDSTPKKLRNIDHDEYVPSSSEEEEHYGEDVTTKTLKSHTKASRRVVAIDDANPRNYKRRVDQYKTKLLRDKAEGYEAPDDKILDGGLRVPGRIWERLYKYQQTGVKWLWELHTQQTGGILGDEMGLGKTIEVIAFLAALSKSKIRDRDSSYSYDGLGPVLIVTPATVMHQWVRELHEWAPMLRAAVLHSSGSHKGSQKDLITNIVLSHGVLITSYERVRRALDLLLARGWHYVILDEGHKIRNPEADVTHAVKMFPTPHRLILSGSPIQNHLRELWSLFDFVFPGKLGTLPVFMEQFSVPIVQGGYANASEVEVQTAYKCACMLRSTIAPYLLRRMKEDVQSHIQLPEKSDQVLFCSLTDHQVEVYQNYLNSDTVNSILSRNLQIFIGLIQLRKICNHPDLYTGGHKILVGENTPEYGDERRFGFWKRSGKMIVVESLLRIWKKQGKKVLLFTQSKMMLNVLEDFVKSQKYIYLCMHGGTSIGSRQPMVKNFNEDPGIFVFILTTRVGGLGINLIGADRVVIYDPDWNPSTDAQAQERAWRIGQKKQVTIYRLLTTGTIEEKIYHRQIFKHFVSNRILKDPKQRRFFKANDMHELFTLSHQEDDPKKKRTETAAIFAGTGSEVKIRSAKDKSSRSSTLAKAAMHPDCHTAKSDSTNCAIIRPEHIELKNTDRNLSHNDCNTNLHPSEISSPCQKKTTTANQVSSLSTSNQEDKPHEAANRPRMLPLIMPPDIKPSSDDANTSEPTTSRTISKQIECDTESTKEIVTSDKATSVADQEVINSESDVKSAKLKSSFQRALQKFRMSKETANTSKRQKKKDKNDVDGECVPNVIKKSKYKKKEKKSKDLNKSDDYVLSKLFNKGVHSAMKHTTIMDSSTPDYALVESEASRVAKEAVRNIRLSRQQYRYPQMTSVQRKRFGKAVYKIPKKRPHERDNSSSEEESDDSPRFGPANSAATSSSTLLRQMRKRNHIEVATTQHSSDDEATNDELISDENKLLQSLVEFVSSQAQGEATTAEVMAEFKDGVKLNQAATFKAMLHQVCEPSTSENGETKWILKPEFR